VTIRITLKRVSDGEVRMTVDGDLQIGGDPGALLCPQAGAAAGENAAARTEDAVRQELLTVAQTAEVLQISRDQLYDLIRTGQLRSMKIGRLRRISRQRISEFIARQEA
jgi:excisionase family DNA binding protein